MKPLTANELRIGNYIATPNQTIFRIDEMEYWGTEQSKVCMCILEGTHPLTWQLPDCYPIPITEEWLVKFWFYKWKQNTAGAIWATVNDEIIFYDCQIVQWYKHEHVFERRSQKIESVHQLQNLYHALTGIELTLKEL